MPQWNRKVPFDSKGNLLHYPEVWGGDQAIVWKEVFEFEDTLQFMEFRRGRSAAYALLRGTDDVEYPMALADFETVIPHLQMGMLTCKWTFRKFGGNFFVRPVLDKDGQP